MSEELKPCPWCGEEPQAIGGGRVAHACRVIDRELRMGAAAWNERAEPGRGCSESVRFERVRECAMTRTFHAWPCSDWECSACGKVHSAPMTNERCPRCGSIVTEVTP